MLLIFFAFGKCSRYYYLQRKIYFMETQNETSIFDLVIDSEGSGYLAETAKWGRLLSILGIILSVIMVLAGLVIAVIGSSINSFAGLRGMGPILGIVYVALGLLYLYPSWVLLKFASAMPSALKKNDQVLVNEALKNLKSCFRFWGIISLIIIGLYALVFIGGILFASFR
jgi:hypothetical protein